MSHPRIVLHKDGFARMPSLRYLGGRLGVSPMTAARLRAGQTFLEAVPQRDAALIVGRDGKHYAPPRVRLVRIAMHQALRAEGLSERQIAARTGWPRPTVHCDLHTTELTFSGHV